MATLAEVHVGGLVMTGTAPGVWVVEKDGLGGWFDGVAVAADVVDRPGAHGSFATPAYRRGRIVTLQAVALAADEVEAGARRREAAALLADGIYSELQVTEPDGHVTSAMVRIDGMPLVAWRPGWDYVRAQWQFYSADPYRYGATQIETTGLAHDTGGLQYPLYTDGAGTDVGFLDYGDYGTEGTVTMVNAGSAETWPRFEVQGPAPLGFTITETATARRLVFTGAVPTGSVVNIDSATAQVLQDGSPRGNFLTVREWTPVPANGSATFVFTAPSGSPVLTVEATEKSW